MLFPPNLGDFIPEDAPVRLISDVVDQLDLTEVHNSYSQTDEGQPPYHPVMQMKAVLYGYLHNTFSTREIEDTMSRDGKLMRVTRVKKGHTLSGFPNDVTVMTCDYCDDCPFKQQCAVTKNNKCEIQRRLGNMIQFGQSKIKMGLGFVFMALNILKLHQNIKKRSKKPA